MLRSIEVDIARRLSFSKQQRAFTRWVAGFAALGMALGVASLIVVLSVMPLILFLVETKIGMGITISSLL